jgi:protein gp37
MSKIQWTDETSNPIHLVKSDGSNGGHWCHKISEGCTNCYAEAQNNNAWFSFASQLKYTGKPPDLILDEEILKGWQTLKKPHKIFVCSMTDMFGDWVTDEWILKIFTYFCRCPHHTFQLLTKRPERMSQIINHLAWRTAKDGDWTYSGYIAYLAHSGANISPNIWIGTSVENQNNCDRIKHLCLVKNSTRFLSIEPLLGEIDLRLNDVISTESEVTVPKYQLINWVIIGGESGKNARTCNVQWIRSLVNQCQEYNIPVFVKQLGSNSVDEYGNKIKLKDKKGGDINEFPVDLKVREFPKIAVS